MDFPWTNVGMTRPTSIETFPDPHPGTLVYPEIMGAQSTKGSTKTFVHESVYRPPDLGARLAGAVGRS